MGKAARLYPTVVLAIACGLGGYALAKHRHPSGSTAAGGEAEKAAASFRSSRPREEAALPAFRKMIDSGGHDPGLWRVVRRLGRGDIESALELLAAIPEPEKKAELFSAFYHRWADLDPQAALEAAMRTRDEHLRSTLVMSVLCAWIKTDPGAAFQAVQNGHNRQFWRDATNMIVRTWTEETVSENLKEFPQGEQQDRLLFAYCEEAVLDPARRDRALTMLKENPEKLAWYMGVFMFWVSQEPGAAFAAVGEWDGSALQRRMLETGLLMDPSATFKWVAEQKVPPGGASWASWESGYQVWLALDTAAAREWFRDQSVRWNEEGEWKAVAGFIAKDFETFTGGKRFEERAGEAAEALRQQVRLWQAHDPEAAGEWIDLRSEAVRNVLKGGDHE